MSQLIVHVGDFTFQARFEEALAPKTCAAFKKAMPFESQAIHVRWSGEGVWMPLGDLDFGVGYENHTSYPAPGHIILYPGGISETEILLAYSGVHFASKMGQLAGNHFITLTSNLESLPEMGKTVLWKGAQKVRFEAVRWRVGGVPVRRIGRAAMAGKASCQYRIDVRIWLARRLLAAVADVYRTQ